jgi:hypothetical protein
VRTLWLYAYQIVPPLPARRLGPLRSLLREEMGAARQDARVWSGRLVLDRRATHILIVSGTVGRDDAINLRLDNELKRLEAPYCRTAPLAVLEPAGGEAPASMGEPSA